MGSLHCWEASLGPAYPSLGHSQCLPLPGTHLFLTFLDIQCPPASPALSSLPPVRPVSPPNPPVHDPLTSEVFLKKAKSLMAESSNVHTKDGRASLSQSRVKAAR